jgi:hypothetical protein
MQGICGHPLFQMMGGVEVLMQLHYSLHLTFRLQALLLPHCWLNAKRCSPNAGCSAKHLLPLRCLAICPKPLQMVHFGNRCPADAPVVVHIGPVAMLHSSSQVLCAMLLLKCWHLLAKWQPHGA